MKGRKRLIIVMIFILLFTMIFPSCDSSGEEVVIMVKYLKNDRVVDRVCYFSSYREIKFYPGDTMIEPRPKNDAIIANALFYCDSEVKQTVQAYYTVPNDPDFDYCWKPLELKIYNHLDNTLVEDITNEGFYYTVIEACPDEGDNWDLTRLILYIEVTKDSRYDPNSPSIPRPNV